MARIALVTDSSCDLPKEVVEKWNIEVVPLRIVFSHGEYRDGIDLTTDEVVDRLSEEIPTTSMPSPSDIHATFQRLQRDGFSHCIVLPISAAMSGTYNTFRLAAEEHEGIEIKVIDSSSLSWELGLIILEVARLIHAGLEFNDIIAKVDDIKQKVKGYFVLDTLEYLKKGGRIGTVASSIGSLLNIKPIITPNNEGKFVPYTIARGKKQATRKMIQPIHEQLKNTRASIAVFHIRAEEEAKALLQQFQEMENVREVYLGTVSPTLLVHSGPGLLGIAISTCDHAE
ncbi:DegV family protein [Mechercharimyces sp. CAU 1602]|uniref:DegV family protein n=1 Tax=Mechercharimyces sp. CAU 1602 TaxID=2973933 RepID=UPI002162145B|nr:DegV family protein [Mechercharimyces sp. CAU 1602]MCS1351656.1 DegV family protein [Mechercharimyces sp. CAU 1602]